MSLIESSKSVKVIPFTGKRDEFFLWSVRFLSYCEVQGCKKVLLGLEIPPNSSARIDETIPAGVEQMRIRKANSTAMTLLNLSLTDMVSVNAVYNSKTPGLPDGNAAIAWHNLKEIYSPTSISRKNELIQEFNTCCLIKEEMNPDEFFAKLEYIRMQLLVDYQINYDKDKMKQHILYNVIQQCIIQLFQS
jgi:hypothetical protein